MWRDGGRVSLGLEGDGVRMRCGGDRVRKGWG